MVEESRDLRTIVSFQAHFGYASPEGMPAGAAMADFLESELNARGLLVDARRNTEDSHVFHVISGSRRFGLLLGLIEDDEREWLILTYSRLGRVRRIFGARDDDEYTAMAAVIHEVLCADERISDVRWYTEQSWHENPLDDWVGRPFETNSDYN